jgi:hypothetical protein
VGSFNLGAENGGTGTVVTDPPATSSLIVSPH